MTATLRDGRQVQVAEHATKYNRAWQREITDYVVTTDGERVEGWRIRELENTHPGPASYPLPGAS